MAPYFNVHTSYVAASVVTDRDRYTTCNLTE